MENGLTSENCERAILRLVLNEYSVKHRLSKRESEILAALVDGSTNTSDLSSHLGISPNTTNNHLKRMMDKTGNSSKLDLITKFYKFMMNRLAYAYLYSKKPKVLLVDDEQDFGEMMVDDLNRRGMHTYFESDPELALSRMAEIYPDFVLLDIFMPRIDGVALLRKIRDQLPHSPFIIIISGHLPDEALLLENGAAAVFTKPVNADELFNTIVDLYSDPPIKGLRLTRVRIDLKASLKSYDMDVKVINLGYSGAFIRPQVARQDFWTKLAVGTRFELTLVLGGNKLKINAEVVWQRMTRDSQGFAGVGVRFIDTSPDKSRLIRNFVRSQRLNVFAPSS